MTAGNTPTVIRRATVADLPAMVSLLQELFAIEADFQGDPFRQELGLRQLLAHPGGHAWVAEHETQVIGMCTLQVLISTAEGGTVGLIEDVVVTGNWRGSGVGRLLLETVEAWAVEQGLSRLQLLADRENGPALTFYQRLGWSRTQLLGLRKTL